MPWSACPQVLLLLVSQFLSCGEVFINMKRVCTTWQLRRPWLCALSSSWPRLHWEVSPNLNLHFLLDLGLTISTRDCAAFADQTLLHLVNLRTLSVRMEFHKGVIRTYFVEEHDSAMWRVLYSLPSLRALSLTVAADLIWILFPAGFTFNPGLRSLSLQGFRLAVGNKPVWLAPQLERLQLQTHSLIYAGLATPPPNAKLRHLSVTSAVWAGFALPSLELEEIELVATDPSASCYGNLAVWFRKYGRRLRVVKLTRTVSRICLDYVGAGIEVLQIHLAFHITCSALTRFANLHTLEVHDTQTSRNPELCALKRLANLTDLTLRVKHMTRRDTEALLKPGVARLTLSRLRLWDLVPGVTRSRVFALQPQLQYFSHGAENYNRDKSISSGQVPIEPLSGQSTFFRVGSPSSKEK
jgi:hypothetical protein